MRARAIASFLCIPRLNVPTKSCRRSHSPTCSSNSRLRFARSAGVSLQILPYSSRSLQWSVVEPGLVEQHTAVGTDVVTLAVAVESSHLAPVRGRVEQPEQEPDRGRLPGPVGAEEAEDRPRSHSEVEVVDGGHVTEPDREPFGDDGRGPRAGP